MFGPVEIYQAPTEATLTPSDEEVCGKSIWQVKNTPEEWMILSSRLDLIESVAPFFLNQYGLNWEHTIFSIGIEGTFLKVSASQFDIISNALNKEMFIIKENDSHLSKAIELVMLKNLLRSREEYGYALPMIACEQEIMQLIQQLGSNVVTSWLFLHIGQIRNLKSEEFSALSPYLPVGCCHLVSQTQLKGLNFACFSPGRLEALIRGSGAHSEFIARLRVLSESQITHLISNSTPWLRENIPPEVVQNTSLSNLIMSLDALRV
jgi:hypothetical protein